MKKSKLVLVIILALGFILIAAFYLVKKGNNELVKTETTTASPTQTSNQAINSPLIEKLATPILDFKTRITKKPFGIYITAQNSPIQEERFAGYHTGSDAEYEDISSDVPVYAISDGTIVLSKYASGYGGVFMMSFDLNGKSYNALYGHIRPSSLPGIGTKFKKGDQIALLGTGYSSETDGERRHLHFAILSDDRLDIRGYVQNKEELSLWIDPSSVLP